ncbi:MAG: aspartyl-tRNA(Asn)/glutamyl-tRNA (Gln) amidotransferase subunit C [Parcubacteria group bacterium Gr01-1014_29]|nr:MAG: aspartyl-tRNA(Asn)/glutamyl-tRNA (Gln) amidotransferase subunit C [Parcubacteria group bacterium Gr01-1014_29]
MITKHDIQKLAILARIDVSDTEVEHLQRDLERVLGYVEKLNQAETGAVDPLTHVLGSVNVTRSDNESSSRYEYGGVLVEAAPQHKDGYVAVRSIWNGKR